MGHNAQVVESRGIIHGLPTYEDDGPGKTGLTAIVTGATGVSGFHMVKVLASAPQRWRKIYAMSRRPLVTDDFYRDIGEGAERVEHLAVDFQDDPAKIAASLAEKIDHVDYIFHFSYMQPVPKENIPGLWPSSEELDTVNRFIFSNWLSALQLSGLKFKRFMLQTGAKHYAFFVGPAPVPALESDPRVYLDKIFYYAQEDALDKYCRSIGASWTISRPCYIVGAARDGTLNHLIGVGIYAAVQAHLGLTMDFPGDYYAWDRESAQTSGFLNAYFEEWLALTDKAAGESFNITDGVGFSWGRLWPYIAGWYNVPWNPPETDESKFRVMTVPHTQTPRGYGPQTKFRSTFSLLEWSQKPEVIEAWAQLRQKHGLTLDPFDGHYRTRVFGFSDSALIGDVPIALSINKAHQYGFFGTADSYHCIFNAMRDLARLKLIPAPVVQEYPGNL